MGLQDRFLVFMAFYTQKLLRVFYLGSKELKTSAQYARTGIFLFKKLNFVM